MPTRAELSEIATTQDGGHTRLMRAAHEGDVKAIQVLCTSSEVNAADNEGRTPIMFATVNRHREAVTELLKRGADVNAQDNGGHTALSFAALSGDAEMVRLLLSHGADVSPRVASTGETALAIAQRNKHDDVVRILEEHGAQMRRKNG